MIEATGDKTGAFLLIAIAFDRVHFKSTFDRNLVAKPVIFLEFGGEVAPSDDFDSGMPSTRTAADGWCKLNEHIGDCHLIIGGVAEFGIFDNLRH